MSPSPVSVSFHPLAGAEYMRARRWYARRSASAEARFRAGVDAAIQRVTALPHVGAVVFRYFRQVRIRGFPYTLNYRVVSPHEIRAVALAHTSRRPGDWRRRMP